MRPKMTPRRLSGFLLSFMNLAVFGYAQVMRTGQFELRSMRLADFNKTEEINGQKYVQCATLCHLKDCNCFVYQDGLCSIGVCLDRTVYEKGKGDTPVYTGGHVLLGCFDDTECPGEFCKAGECLGEREVALAISGSVAGQSTTYLTSVEIIGECSGPPPPMNPLPVPVFTPGSAVMDGLIYVCGGRLADGSILSNCYVRGLGGIWGNAPKMKQPRYTFSMNTLGDKIVAAGGKNTDILSSFETLTLGSGEWEYHTFTLPVPTQRHCGVSISSYELVVIAGYDANIFMKDTVQLFNFDTTSQTVLKNYPLKAGSLACTIDMEAGTIFTSGGYNGVYNIYTDVYSLDIRTRSPATPWVQMPSMISGRRGHTMLLVNGILTVYGGAEGTMEEYVDGAWQISSMAQRSYHASALILC